MELAIKKVKCDSFIYMDKFRSYSGVISYGFKNRRIDHGKRFANGKVYIHGIEGFWPFAKERLLKYQELMEKNFLSISKNWSSDIATETEIVLMISSKGWLDKIA